MIISDSIDDFLYGVPGIYRKIPFQSYLALDAISNTALATAAQSMAHYKVAKPKRETRQMLVGTLTHAAQFEPSWVNDRFAFMPDFTEQVQREREAEIQREIEALEAAVAIAQQQAQEKPDTKWKRGQSPDELRDKCKALKDGPKRYDSPGRTSRHRELVDDFTRSHADKSIITEQEFTELIGMVRALSNDQRARRFLTGGMYEVTIVAIDPVTGLLCKGRIDHLNLQTRLITDLKTTSDGSDFEWTIYNWCYHRQLALYGDMLGWIDPTDEVEIETRALVAVEQTDPHCVQSAPLDEEAIEEGREEYRELLDGICACKQSGNWPGYANPDKWRLPPNRRRRKRVPVNVVVGNETITV